MAPEASALTADNAVAAIAAKGSTLPAKEVGTRNWRSATNVRNSCLNIPESFKVCIVFCSSTRDGRASNSRALSQQGNANIYAYNA